VASEVTCKYSRRTVGALSLSPIASDADPSMKSGHRLTGDVAYAEVAPKCAAITPVPGGVGPMTIAMLLENTVFAAERAVKNA